MEMNVWFRRWIQKLRVQNQRPQKIITGKKDWAQIKEIRPVPGWISELQRTSGCILSSSLFLNRSVLRLSCTCTIAVHPGCRGACINNSSPRCTVLTWGAGLQEPHPRHCTEGTPSGPGFDLYDKILDFRVDAEMELDFRGFREQLGRTWSCCGQREAGRFCFPEAAAPVSPVIHSAAERPCHAPAKGRVCISTVMDLGMHL